MSVRVEFRWSEDLLGRLDQARKTRLGEISRSAFVRDAVEFKIMQAEAVRDLAEDPTGEHARRAVERALSDTQGPPTKEQADPGPVPSSEGVRSAAPAEQPEVLGWKEGTPPMQAFVRRVSPSGQPEMTAEQAEIQGLRNFAESMSKSTVARAEEVTGRVSAFGPVSPRVPFRRDVKPFQRGDK